jgi:hypothetical protein
MIESRAIKEYHYVVKCDLCNKYIASTMAKFDDEASLNLPFAGLGFREDDGILCVEDKAGMCDFHICNACIATIYRSHKSRLDNRD